MGGAIFGKNVREPNTGRPGSIFGYNTEHEYDD